MSNNKNNNSQADVLVKIESPDYIIKKIGEAIGDRGRLAFISAAIIGLLTHLAIMTSDIPNHDGLDSMYSSQNMITSGRWFLSIACSFSSYFSLPWVIGVLSLIFLGITSVILTKLFNIRSKIIVILISAFLVTFPAIVSCFAYSFTMDGYMLGIMLCVLSVYVTKKYKWGFIPGGVILAFGIGIYQAYLCITMLLSLYMVALILLDKKKIAEKVTDTLKYAGMGVLGLSLYYIILNVLLKAEGKVLDSYQGIEDMGSGNGLGILGTIKEMYSDFISFSLNGHVFMPNRLTVMVYAVLLISVAAAFIMVIAEKKLYKNIFTYVFALVFIGLIPCVANGILAISTGVNYHLIMRFTWGFFGILALAFIDYSTDFIKKANIKYTLMWASVLSCIIIVFVYAVTDNIAYSNLQKKYEKTYAYCLRLADRIEQTQGYYEGIPVAMVGVVGDVNFPETDITGKVTGSIIGANGDYLLYKGENYDQFFRHYLGITFNILSEDNVADFYFMEEYQAMPSFPDEGSTKVIDGVLYVKTENATEN